MGGPRIFLTVTFLDLLRTLDGEVEERVLLCHLRYPMDPERLERERLEGDLREFDRLLAPRSRQRFTDCLVLQISCCSLLVGEGALAS